MRKRISPGVILGVFAVVLSVTGSAAAGSLITSAKIKDGTIQGRDIRTEAYMAKIFGDTQSFHAADRCMEIHGGMGLATDLPIEKFWRDQRSMMITEGPIEILKMTLARHVLRTYG